MSISILIPTFNDSCFTLVSTLRDQLLAMEATTRWEELKGAWEIIVADDCSTNAAVRAENAKIDSLNGCRVEWRTKNVGRAAIRNFLAQQAKGDWLLFIDSDMVIRRKDFVERYLTDLIDHKGVLYGGYEVNPPSGRSNCSPPMGGAGGGALASLRYIYETKNAYKHSVEERRKQPYRDFHTSNFMISRDVMLRIPFNEDFKMYGYEDVLLGKQLEETGVPIHHIDNPVSFEIFETNEDFLRKTEESVRTQIEFSHLLGDYSTLIRTARRIESLHLTWLVRLMSKLFANRLRRYLCTGKPNIFALNVYKLMKYTDKDQKGLPGGGLFLLLGFLAILALLYFNFRPEASPSPLGEDRGGASGGAFLADKISEQSRLYTAEVQMHKVFIAEDPSTVSVPLIGNINLPGERKIAIPTKATVKAYIDFSTFSKDNVKIDGDNIIIQLPKPAIVLSSTELDHDNIRKNVSFFRYDFTDKEFTEFSKQSRQDIINAIPKTGIIEKAQSGAAAVLVPMIQQLGYQDKNIQVVFDKEVFDNPATFILK